MFSNKVDMVDNLLISKFKQSNLFFIVKMFGNLIWKAQMVGKW